MKFCDVRIVTGDVLTDGIITDETIWRDGALKIISDMPFEELQCIFEFKKTPAALPYGQNDVKYQTNLDTDIYDLPRI